MLTRFFPLYLFRLDQIILVTFDKSGPTQMPGDAGADFPQFMSSVFASCHPRMPPAVRTSAFVCLTSFCKCAGIRRWLNASRSRDGRKLSSVVYSSSGWSLATVESSSSSPSSKITSRSSKNRPGMTYTHRSFLPWYKAC